MSNFDYEGFVIIYNHMREDGLRFVEKAFEKDCPKCVPIMVDDSILVGLDYSPCVGYANLENRDEGVYAGCTLHCTKLAKLFKHIFKNTNNLEMGAVLGGIKQKDDAIVSGYIRAVCIIPRDKLLKYIQEDDEC